MGEEGSVFDFVQFLVEREEIGERYAATVRERAGKERAPIGQLLIRRGLMKVREVMHVLDLQADRPERRFGDLAVEAELLSRDDLEAILEYQRNHRLHQTEIIYGERLMSDARCFHLIVSYIKYMEKRSQEGAADPTNSLMVVQVGT